MGQSFVLYASVTNQGLGSAAATTLRYYLSTDDTISASDTELGTDSVPSLGYGNIRFEDITLTAPSSAGTYYYGACVDAVSGESFTSNNCVAGDRITVLSSPPAPDLVVQSPSVNDNTLTAGQFSFLNATVRNQGTAVADATTLRFYRSTNSTISTSDTYLGAETVSSLRASGYFPHSAPISGPSLAGTYYYGACVDSVSGESNTANNCSVGVLVTVQ